MRKSLIVALTCILALSACGGPSFKGTVRKNPTPAPEFALTDQNGQPFKLSDERGKVVFLFFGYTFCPDECPTTLVSFEKAQQMLGAEAADVKFVLVTVDPTRDTAARLTQYLKVFSPDFIGLWGSLNELQKVWGAYGVYVKTAPPEQGASGYAIEHSTAVYVIDQVGRWRLVENYNAPPEDFVNDARILLKG